MLTESAATHVGRIATIVTGAVREVTHEVGDWATDAFEMRDAARQGRGRRDRSVGTTLIAAAYGDPRFDVVTGHLWRRLTGPVMYWWIVQM